MGFQFIAVLTEGFDKLPNASKYVHLGSFGLIALTIVLLMTPAAYHRLVERGEDTREQHRYTSNLMTWALLPFALGLGLDFYVAAQKVFGWKWGAAAGLLATLVAASFWYFLEFYMRRERAPDIEAAKREGREMGGEEGGVQDRKREEREKLSNKIKHVLTECRVVLPGSQALLGFQFVVILTESFDKLSPLSKYIHLAALGLNALTIVLLITPAAYHRMVERGEETEHFHRFASKVLVAALVPLALALASDVYVVVQKVTDSQLVSVVSALVVLAVFWELWFGLTLYRRTQRQYAD